MKKNILNIYAISALSLFGFVFTSCDQDEDVVRTGKPTISVDTASKSISVDENGDASVIFNQSYMTPFVNNTNSGSNSGAELRIEVIGGTAEEGVDYNFNLDTIEDAGFNFWGGEGYYLPLPGNTLKHELQLSDILSVNFDADVEGTETIELAIHSVVLGQIIANDTMTITINDYAPTTLDILLDLDGNITIDGNTVNKCAFDFDLYVSDDNTLINDLGHSWLGPVGNCSELFSLGLDGNDTPGSENGFIDNDPTNWNDGTTYYVWIDLWDSSAAPAITAHEDVPMNIVFTKVIGGVSTDITLSIPALYRTDDQDSNNGTGGSKIAAKLEINGNSYIVTNLITGEVTAF